MQGGSRQCPNVGSARLQGIALSVQGSVAQGLTPMRQGSSRGSRGREGIARRKVKRARKDARRARWAGRRAGLGGDQETQGGKTLGGGMMRAKRGP